MASKSENMRDEDIRKIEEGGFNSTNIPKTNYNIGFCSSAAVVTITQKVNFVIFFFQDQKLIIKNL